MHVTSPNEGAADGIEESVGISDGFCVGDEDASSVGLSVGASDGRSEGEKLFCDSMSVVRAMQGGDMIASEATHVTIKALHDVESSVSN